MTESNLYQKYYEDVDYKLLDNKYIFQKYSEIEQKRIFIKNGIYVQLHTPYMIKEPYPVTPKKLRYEPENKFHFGCLFFLDNKIYEPNPKLFYDLGQETMKNALGDFNFYLERLKEEIDYEISIRLPDEKIEFYKLKRKKLMEDFDLIKVDKFEWVNSFINPKVYGYKDILDCLISDYMEFVEEVEDYLFNHKIYKLTVHIDYINTYSFHNLILYLNELIINNSSASTIIENISVNTRNDIFKDNESRMLFEFIIENCEKDKNTSFYSMLYKYLQDKNKIILIDNDSVLYRNFIMNTYNLSSFSRIQNKSSNKEQTVWNSTFKTFDKLTEFFFTQQSE